MEALHCGGGMVALLPPCSDIRLAWGIPLKFPGFIEQEQSCNKSKQSMQCTVKALNSYACLLTAWFSILLDILSIYYTDTFNLVTH